MVHYSAFHAKVFWILVASAMSLAIAIQTKFKHVARTKLAFCMPGKNHPPKQVSIG